MEDQVALGLLGARPVWLSFLDSKYGDVADCAEVARALADVLAEAQVVVAPLGLVHPDHVMVADACLAALDQGGDSATKTWILYAESPYRMAHDGRCVQDRLNALRAQGFSVEFVDLAARRPPDRCSSKSRPQGTAMHLNCEPSGERPRSM
jgi:LmbE family N-acetylglucosaminyl deacetylase